jgi:hypothetical protein
MPLGCTARRLRTDLSVFPGSRAALQRSGFPFAIGFRHPISKLYKHNLCIARFFAFYLQKNHNAGFLQHARG